MTANHHPNDHQESHGPSGHRHGRRGTEGSRLAFILVLVVGYMIAEVVGGLLTNSLALLADAGHMLSDAAALGLSLFALWVARRPPTPQHTYGYYRAEVLAALANGASLIAISIYIFVEAAWRLREPPEVLGAGMATVALGGLVVNLVGLWLLGGHHVDNLNVRAAWLHLFADMLGSVAALVAAGLVWALGWNWADPVASAVIGLLVVRSAWELLKQAVAILMEGAPGHMDVDAVRDALAGLPGVREVHDLHVWSITTGLEALSAHLVVGAECPGPPLLHQARDTLRERFGIGHVTLQIEPEAFHEGHTPFCNPGLPAAAGPNP